MAGEDDGAGGGDEASTEGAYEAQLALIKALKVGGAPPEELRAASVGWCKLTLA